MSLELTLPEPPSLNVYRRRGRPSPFAEVIVPKLASCSADGPCIIYDGEKLKAGYVRAWFKGRRTVAHRLTYELIRGPIPDGLTLDHLCRQKACVNPFHLEAVTQTENRRRAARLITHCPHGHPYSGDNLRVYQGRRFCKTCGGWKAK